MTERIDGTGTPAAGLEPLTPAAAIDVLTRLGPAAPSGGAAPVTRLLIDVTGAVGADRTGPRRFADAEFVTALTVELVRRYLRAVRSHARGAPVAKAWKVVLDCGGRPEPSRQRVARAGVNALVDHDLALALVTTCTLLGRAPGPAERRDVDELIALIGDRLSEISGPDAGGTAATGGFSDLRGLAFLLTRSESWRRAEHLWTLRGRPAEAEAERASIDWHTSLVGRGLLTEPV